MLTTVRDRGAADGGADGDRPRAAGRRGRWVAAVLLLLLLAVPAVVVATGERDGSAGSAPTSYGWPEPYPEKDPSGAGGAADEGRTGAVPGEAAAPAEPGRASADPAAPVDPGAVPLGGVARDLVRTAQLSLTADDPADAARRARGAVATAGGTVVEEESHQDGSRFVVRVPADRLDALVDDLAALGTPTNRSSQVVDATEQVVDLDSRVRSQQASVERVRALLAQTASIGEVVSVESELTRREAELDSLTARLAALRDQVALSTLSVDVSRPGAVPPPPVEPQPGFLGGLGAGWAGLQALGAAAGAVAGFLLPFLPLIALMVGGALLLRRRRGRSGPGTAGES